MRFPPLAVLLLVTACKDASPDPEPRDVDEPPPAEAAKLDVWGELSELEDPLAEEKEEPMRAGPMPKGSDATPQQRQAKVLELLAGGGSATRLPVDAGDPKSADRVQSVTIGKPRVTGDFPPDVLQRIVRVQYGSIRRCYQYALAEEPGLEGTLEIAFRIDADGSASKVRALEGKLPSRLGDCIAKVLLPRELPEPPAGKPVKVVVPLTLTPK